MATIAGAAHIRWDFDGAADTPYPTYTLNPGGDPENPGDYSQGPPDVIEGVAGIVEWSGYRLSFQALDYKDDPYGAYLTGDGSWAIATSVG